MNISRRTFIRTMAVGTGSMALLSTELTVHAAGPQTFSLRIVHTNDHHAHLEPVPVPTATSTTHGGVTRRKTMIDAIRADATTQNQPLIVLDAGDIFQGTLYFTQYKGFADLEFYGKTLSDGTTAAMQYEAMTLGNHEFDIGQQPLADFIKEAVKSFPVLSANLVVDATSPLAGLVQPWVIKQVGGEKIGIFGLTTQETAELSNTGAGVSFGDPFAAATKAVADLKAQGVTKIIALTHLGITVDRELAQKVDGISIIIGGHSHTPMGPEIPQASATLPASPYPEVLTSPSGQPVIMATDWEWGRWLGDLTVGFDATGAVTGVVAAKPTEVATAVATNPAFDARIAELAKPLTELRQRQIGSTAVVLDGERANVRTKETNFGNLAADATLFKTASGGAQIAIVNGGGVRTSIPVGNVTLGQVLEVFPFGNTLVLLTVTGEQVIAALENGVSQVEAVAGRFPQVGGMRFSFDPTKPAGSRVTGVQVLDKSLYVPTYVPISLTKTYRLVVNNFQADGGDGYTVLAKGTDRINTGFLDSDVLSEYFQAKSPVNPKVEGRILIGGTLTIPSFIALPFVSNASK